MVVSSGPLPSGGAANAPPQYPPTPYPSAGYPAASGPRPRRSGRIVLIVILVVVVLIVAAVAIGYLFAPAGITVQQINIWAPDNVCGLNTNPIAFYGYNDTPGDSSTFQFGMPNYNATACEIRGATTNTSGFSLSGVQVPLPIPVGGTGQMNITITAPSSSFNGILNIVLS